MSIPMFRVLDTPAPDDPWENTPYGQLDDEGKHLSDLADKFTNAVTENVRALSVSGRELTDAEVVALESTIAHQLITARRRSFAEVRQLGVHSLHGPEAYESRNIAPKEHAAANHPDSHPDYSK